VERLARFASARALAADNSAMLFLLSPAKSLDYETAVPDAVPATHPHFEGSRGPAAELIKILRDKSPQQIAELIAVEAVRWVVRQVHRPHDPLRIGIVIGLRCLMPLIANRAVIRFLTIWV